MYALPCTIPQVNTHKYFIAIYDMDISENDHDDCLLFFVYEINTHNIFISFCVHPAKSKEVVDY